MVQLTTNESCNSLVRSAINRLYRRVANGYSTTSKKFSIWSAVAKHLDDPVASYMRSNKCFRIMPYVLSEQMRKPTKQVIDYLRILIRVNKSMAQPSAEFSGTLESIVQVIYFCLTRTPKQSLISKETKSGVEKVRYRTNHKIDLLHYPYCEFCFHLCEFEERFTKKKGFDDTKLNWLIWPSEQFKGAPVTRGLSRRFCSTHKRERNPSQYRSGARHKDKFHKEIQSVKKIFQSGNQRVPSPEEVRRLAYEIVRRNLTPLQTIVMRLRFDTLSQPEIERTLGVDHQSASKALTKISPIFDIYNEILARRAAAEREAEKWWVVMNWLCDEDQAEVSHLADANQDIREAFEWLSQRGLATLQEDDKGQFIELTPNKTPIIVRRVEGGLVMEAPPQRGHPIKRRLRLLRRSKSSPDLLSPPKSQSLGQTTAADL